MMATREIWNVFCLLMWMKLCSRVYGENRGDELSRDVFPESFVFGAGASSYQAEGAVDEDGRGPCLWDAFTHQGKMADKSTGDIAADQYHKYKVDVKLMSDMGLEAYRLSISWSRILPKGRGSINPKGIEFYNKFIDQLVTHGVEPHVTLYHLDFPQALEDEYGGWLSPRIVEDFTAYADLCFREFGDRVTHWTTINEANIVATGSYDIGLLPPQRCTPKFGVVNCTAGNSSVEPYIAAHHMLLAHASAGRLYKVKYQAIQKGLIGINIYSLWFSPLTNSTADIEASQRCLDFYIGWIAHPLVFGDYPEIMKENAGTRLPSFSESESKLVKGSFDFFGLNHYTAVYVEDDSKGPIPNQRDFNLDIAAKFYYTKNDTPSGQLLPSSAPVVPSGLTGVLDYVSQAYGNPPVYIHENGLGRPHNESLNDTARVDYLKGFINATLVAIRSGANVKGYFVWSFLDVFEYLSGYQSRCGLYYVNFDDEELPRTPKLSAYWYSDFLKSSEKMRKIEKAGLSSQAHSAV